MTSKSKVWSRVPRTSLVSHKAIKAVCPSMEPRGQGTVRCFIIIKEKNVCSLFLSPTSSMNVCMCVYVYVHAYVHILSMYTFVWSWTNVHVWREEAIVMYIHQSFSYLFSEEVVSLALVSPAAISWWRSSGPMARSMQ